MVGRKWMCEQCVTKQQQQKLYHNDKLFSLETKTIIISCDVNNTPPPYPINFLMLPNFHLNKYQINITVSSSLQDITFNTHPHAHIHVKHIFSLPFRA